MTILHSAVVTRIVSVNGRGSLRNLCRRKMTPGIKVRVRGRNLTILQPHERAKAVCTMGSMLMPRMSRLHTC